MDARYNKLVKYLLTHKEPKDIDILDNNTIKAEVDVEFLVKFLQENDILKYRYNHYQLIQHILRGNVIPKYVHTNNPFFIKEWCLECQYCKKTKNYCTSIIRDKQYQEDLLLLRKPENKKFVYSNKVSITLEKYIPDDITLELEFLGTCNSCNVIPEEDEAMELYDGSNTDFKIIAVLSVLVLTMAIYIGFYNIL